MVHGTSVIFQSEDLENSCDTNTRYGVPLGYKVYCTLDAPSVVQYIVPVEKCQVQFHKQFFQWYKVLFIHWLFLGHGTSLQEVSLLLQVCSPSSPDTRMFGSVAQLSTSEVADLSSLSSSSGAPVNISLDGFSFPSVSQLALKLRLT